MATAVVDRRTADRAALAALRRARRARRTQDFDIAEAIYRAYITGIVAVIALWLGSGLVGDRRLDAAQAAKVAAHGPAALGLAVAVILAVGLRSGGRGGPLVIEAADVRHVLLSPVDRTAALRGPALRQLRFAVAAGAGVGALGGLLAFRRLPGPAVEWVLSGALAGGVAAAAALGLAMVVSGRRLGPVVANLLALVVVGWAAGDLAAGTLTSPAGAMADIAVWPLRFGPAGLVGVALALVAVAAGRAAVGGTSIEGAERRATLVGQLRFAATTRDLRTVVVLRRQLAQESARSRPWIRLAVPVGPGRRPSHGGARRGAWRRSWHSILRFPAVRLVRMVLAGAVAGAAVGGVWRGTTPLLAVAGIALYVAALDAVEPVAQEFDHPGRAESHAIEEGLNELRLAAAPLLVMVAVAVVGAGVGAALGGSVAALEVGLVMAVPAAAAATAGALLSVVGGAAPSYSGTDAMLPPEAAGVKAILRTGLPPALAVIGVAPVLAGRHHATALAVGPVGAVEVPVVVAVLLAATWIRYRIRIVAAVRSAMAEAAEARRPASGGRAGG